MEEGERQRDRHKESGRAPIKESGRAPIRLRDGRRREAAGAAAQSRVAADRPYDERETQTERLRQRLLREEERQTQGVGARAY